MTGVGGGAHPTTPQRRTTLYCDCGKLSGDRSPLDCHSECCVSGELSGWKSGAMDEILRLRAQNDKRMGCAHLTTPRSRCTEPAGLSISCSGLVALSDRSLWPQRALPRLAGTARLDSRSNGRDAETCGLRMTGSWGERTRQLPVAGVLCPTAPLPGRRHGPRARVRPYRPAPSTRHRSVRQMGPGRWSHENTPAQYCR